MTLALLLAIVGGVVPVGDVAGAVGALGFKGAAAHCSTVLVGPATALTARHCVDFEAELSTEISGQKSTVVAIHRPEGGDAALLTLDPAPDVVPIPLLLDAEAVAPASVVTLAGCGATAWALRSTTASVTWYDPQSYIQFPAGHVGQGDSGGPVALREGIETRVVGVITGTADATSLARYANDPAFVAVSAPWSGRER